MISSPKPELFHYLLVAHREAFLILDCGLLRKSFDLVPIKHLRNKEEICYKEDVKDHKCCHVYSKEYDDYYHGTVQIEDIKL